MVGGRLTGSLALSFIPSQNQSSAADPWQPQSAPLLGHAVMYADDEKKWIPGSSEFVELKLSPHVAANAMASAQRASRATKNPVG